MNTKNLFETRHHRGFTLIELMIVVAALAILTAIAYPSYTNYIREARRADAKTELLQAANRQERFYTSNYAYASSMSELGMDDVVGGPQDGGYYTIAVRSANEDEFEIRATATGKGGQDADACAWIQIDQAGRQTSSAPNECW